MNTLWDRESVEHEDVDVDVDVEEGSRVDCDGTLSCAGLVEWCPTNVEAREGPEGRHLCSPRTPIPSPEPQRGGISTGVR
jgi:hypothetical protein